MIKHINDGYERAMCNDFGPFDILVTTALESDCTQCKENTMTKNKENKFEEEIEFQIVGDLKKALGIAQEIFGENKPTPEMVFGIYDRVFDRTFDEDED